MRRGARFDTFIATCTSIQIDQHRLLAIDDALIYKKLDEWSFDVGLGNHSRGVGNNAAAGIVTEILDR